MYDDWNVTKLLLIQPVSLWSKVSIPIHFAFHNVRPYDRITNLFHFTYHFSNLFSHPH